MMITAGIDVGMENVKVVIFQDGKIIGRGKNRSGGIKREQMTEKALQTALEQAGIAREEIEKNVATGKGKYDISFADDWVTEPITAKLGARFLCPEATCVVDVGADETLVETLVDDRIEQFLVNEKCSAGLGSLLRNMARRLELTMEEMNNLPPMKEDGPRVSDGCPVFAELDALSLLNDGIPPKEIATALTFSAAVRVSATIKDITIPHWDCVVLLGGLTINSAFVQALSKCSGITFTIPEEADYAGALGAALFAAG